MAKRLWAGLDVGVETTSVCVIDEADSIVHECVCRTDLKSIHREIAFLKRRKVTRVGLEAGSGTALARGLRTLGYTVDIYETRKLSRFLRLRRNKTDAGDAIGIAQAGRIGASTVSKVHLKSLNCQMLSSRLTIRRHLIRARLKAQNLLCRLIENFGGRVHRCTSPNLFRSRVEAEIKTLFGRESNALVSELHFLLDHYEALTAHQKAIDCELKRCALENGACRRFMEIPGVGPICALTFLAAVGEPHRFQRSADIGPYLGLTPTIYESGLSRRVGRISRSGNKITRSLLVQASVNFLRFGSDQCTLHQWASAVECRRGKGRARVALARKLAIVMLAMWKNGENFRVTPLDAYS